MFPSNFADIIILTGKSSISAKMENKERKKGFLRNWDNFFRKVSLINGINQKVILVSKQE